MPINPNTLSSPEPEPERDAPERFSENQTTAPIGTSEQPADEPKRKRRTKAELIADAPEFSADDPVEIKDAGTGAKVVRPWSEAAALVRAEKAEFSDKSLKYALLKEDQSQGSDTPVGAPAKSAFDSPELTVEQSQQHAGTTVPPDAEVGDEVRIGSDTLRVGHGRVLTSSPPAVD